MAYERADCWPFAGFFFFNSHPSYIPSNPMWAIGTLCASTLYHLLPQPHHITFSLNASHLSSLTTALVKILIFSKP